MVLVLDGTSEKVAHVRSIICYLICFRQLIRSLVGANRISSPNRLIFPHVCAKYSELPSYVSTMRVACRTIFTGPAGSIRGFGRIRCFWLDTGIFADPGI